MVTDFVAGDRRCARRRSSSPSPRMVSPAAPLSRPVVDSACPVAGRDDGRMSAQATYTVTSSTDLCICTACGEAVSAAKVVWIFVDDDPLVTDARVNWGVGSNWAQVPG